ncbi:MAG: helix-turn-helix domain-containing protein [Nitrospirae bacterium]|nr:helix-turn-helix domain-containing protein [Nitrospirota bacterium]
MTQNTMYDVADMCQLLHMKPAGIYALVYRRAVPFCRLSGRKLLFPTTAVHEWLDSHTTPPTSRENRAAAQGNKKNQKKTKKNGGCSYIDGLNTEAKREENTNENT